jgi:16S rRNA (cytosine1402-N4)-methyltransferase
MKTMTRLVKFERNLAMIEKVPLSLSHSSVLLNEVVKWLNPSNGGYLLDCTFGGGGHTEALSEANENNCVYAIDQDPSGKKHAQVFSLNYQNCRLDRIKFSEVGCLPFPPLDGLAMDLGISSFQLDDCAKGVSFKHHTILGMRMNNSRGITAMKFP